MEKQFLLLILVLTIATATKLTLSLESYDKQCFYEILQSQQKYSFDVSPKIQGKYEVEVSNMIDGQWNSVYYKQAKNVLESLNVHKLAPTDSTYSFCVRNVGDDRIKVSVNIQSGLELMQFQMLPDKNDSENLERQLGWLEGQKLKLFECLQRMQSIRTSSQGLSNLMSTKMVGFAILGLISIVIVNLFFYRELRKTFKDRKLI